MMLHNIAVSFGLKWILWNDLSNGKWYIKLGNTANRMAEHKAEIVGVQLVRWDKVCIVVLWKEK